MRKFNVFFYVLILALFCCKKPYNPPASSTSNSYLVVDGVINLSVDSTVIKISRTVKLNSKTAINPVLNAIVTIEGEQNGAVPLYDINNNGHYYGYDIAISPTQRYRLRIIDGAKQYLSDFVDVKQTPPIDAIGYNVQNGIVNLYVNTHDPANKARYYRWDFEETWIFHSKYQSGFVVDPNSNTIQPRNADQQVYYCFGNDVSPQIILNSTERLSKDIVYESPLTQFQLTSEKIENKYSIMVRQYAITQDAFQFYQKLKNNTEQLGSIFDAQPSQLTGNIHCVGTPDEPVLGYVTATNVQNKRVYILHNDFPGNIQAIYPYNCEQNTALYKDKLGTNEVQNSLINPPINEIPTSAIFSGSPPVIVGYLYSSIECTDCTIRGSKQPPPWWQ